MKKLLAFVLFLWSLPSFAYTYTGLWWIPAESGWGVNVVQQSSTLFATWFVYGADGKPTWFVMSKGASSSLPAQFSGDLYQTTGPTYSSASFDPGSVSVTKVGSANFLFNGSSSLTLSYWVNGQSVTKSLVRQTFAPINIAGRYRLKLFNAHRSGCYASQNNTGVGTGLMKIDDGWSDNTGVTDGLVVTKNIDGSLQIQEASFVFPDLGGDAVPMDTVCTATISSIIQSGPYLNMAGTYSCDGGRKGTVSFSDVEATTEAPVFRTRLFGSFSTQDTAGENCASSGTLTALSQ